LSPWLSGRKTLSNLVDAESKRPSSELGGFVVLQKCLPVHESGDVAAASLEASWAQVDSYVREALELMRADHRTLLDRWEGEQIEEKLGQLPTNCLPIYLVTVGEASSERVVYIGKTSSDTGRFRGGHAAFTKLNAPRFDGQRKFLYLCAIALLSDDKEVLPLEWIRPLEKAERRLKDVEAQLIYRFKPELNEHHVSAPNAHWETQLHIQNVTGVTTFLDDIFVYPAK
jgi:hypothetical protein